MTAPHPRDPRLRRQHDPLAAAVRLSMSADAMRGELLDHGPEPVDLPGDLDVDLAAMFAGIQGATAGEQLTAAEFAVTVIGDDESYRQYEEHEPVAESPAPTSAPVPVAPPAAPTSVDAFSSERSRPRSSWRSRHDPRSRAYGVRRPGVVEGSTPLQTVLLQTGPVFDQQLAGVTLEEQSCCTGTGTVAAINTLTLEAMGGFGHDIAPSVLLGLDDAEAVYQRGQQLDEYPGDDYPGGSVLGAMSAAVELGMIGGYLWCFGTRDIAQTILRRRPVVVGVPWLSGMWETGPGGLVVVEGADEGLGHCLAVNGITLKGPQGQPGPFFRWQQSTGERYGAGGFGFIHHRDLAGLLRGRGEAATPTLEHPAAA